MIDTLQTISQSNPMQAFAVIAQAIILMIGAILSLTGKKR